jgi:hypothetical protein
MSELLVACFVAGLILSDGFLSAKSLVADATPRILDGHPVIC